MPHTFIQIGFSLMALLIGSHIYAGPVTSGGGGSAGTNGDGIDVIWCDEQSTSPSSPSRYHVVIDSTRGVPSNHIKIQFNRDADIYNISYAARLAEPLHVPNPVSAVFSAGQLDIGTWHSGQFNYIGIANFRFNGEAISLKCLASRDTSGGKCNPSSCGGELPCCGPIK